MPCAGNRIAIAIASTGLQESSYVTRTIATRALEHFQHGQLQPVSRYAPQAKNVFFYVKKSKGDPAQHGQLQPVNPYAPNTELFFLS